MNQRLQNGKNVFYVLYLLGFIFTVHMALPAYINSTFLSEYATERLVGIIYAISSIGIIIALAIIPIFLRRFGNYRVITFLAFIQILLLLGLAFFKSIFLVIPIFIVSLVAIMLIDFTADIFLESYSNDGETGSIRGAYLTAKNVAWVLSPMIAGFILTNGDYWKVYLTAAIFMVVVLFLLVSNLKHYKDPAYERVPFWSTFKEVWLNKSIYKIFMANFLLKFFFAWMIIYTPIYLHEYIGFEWSAIGVMFTIMLLPFALFEIPIGKLADTRWGEKEFLTIGFVLMALSVGTLTFIADANFILWTALLFITRIGASIVEIMTESYFFKQIDGTDAHLLGFFRNTYPLAYIIAPLFATGILTVIDYRFLFLVLGGVMLLGLRYSLTLKDTR
ncbi:MAG: MFS transporter [Patescibacteria group bacterium]|nr:MFS transporter [Patescibacteria group bacterium]